MQDVATALEWQHMHTHSAYFMYVCMRLLVLVFFCCILLFCCVAAAAFPFVFARLCVRPVLCQLPFPLNSLLLLLALPHSLSLSVYLLSTVCVCVCLCLSSCLRLKVFERLQPVASYFACLRLLYKIVKYYTNK